MMSEHEREYPCLTCGRTDGTVPVWQDSRSLAEGGRPDYVGCVHCGEMITL